MKEMEIETKEPMPIVYTYRYTWKDVKGQLYVRYVTDTLENLFKFDESIMKDSNVVAAMREYINEINYAFINFTTTIKTDKQEKEENVE